MSSIKQPIPADSAIADLPTISFSRLAAREPAELEKLLESCRGLGFFYLDLRGDASKNILNDWRSVLDFMEKYFGQDYATKMKDDRQSDTHGYEPVGTSAGAHPGELDYYETLKVARGELADHDPRLPPMVQDRLPLFERFVGNSQFVTMTLLRCLSDVLGLPDATRLERFHRTDQPSRTTLVLFRYPQDEKEKAGVGHNKHTDIGSLTLLFSEQYGLQVLSPEKQEWQFIKPKAQHAVINVGDSLRFLSGKKLYSCVHRVVPTAEQQYEHRYSIAYFLRAEDNASYADSNGRTLTAKDWHDGKYEVFRQKHDQQALDTILTGGMEKGEAVLVN